jgi:hypothetical protein
LDAVDAEPFELQSASSSSYASSVRSESCPPSHAIAIAVGSVLQLRMPTGYKLSTVQQLASPVVVSSLSWCK